MTIHHETATPARDDAPLPSIVTEVLESISDGVCMLDHAWRLTYVNRHAAAYLGVRPADLIGKQLWDTFPQLNGTEAETLFRATMETRQPCHFEMPAFFADRWHHLQLSPSPDGMVVCFQDITKRKTMEQALEASERRYRELLTYAPSAIYEIDFRRKRFVTVNDAMCRLTGYTRDELLAMDPYDLLDDDGRKAIQDRIDRWLAGQPPDENVEYLVKAKDGHLIYALLDVTFTVDEQGQPLGATAVGHDISQRRQSDEALRESETRYRQVVENTTAVILRLDTHGVITFANQHALAFFGYTEDELIGRHAVGSIVPPQETSGRDLAVIVEQIVRRPDDFHANSNENMRKNGERVWMEWTNSGIYDAEGNLKEFLAVGIDATERIRAEEALRQSEARLRLAVSNSNIVLSQFDRELRYTWIAHPHPDFAASELIGKSGVDVEDSAGMRRLDALKRRVIETGTGLCEEVTFQRSDGTHTYETSIEPLLNDAGEVIGGTVSGFDVTERKQVLEALRESEEKFRLLADMTQTAIAIVQDGLIQYANPFLLQHGGYREEDLLGQSFLCVTHPDYRAMLLEYYQQRLQGKVVPGCYEIEGVRRDGGHAGWYDLQASAIEYRGRPAIIVTAHDITERKRMEQALVEADRAKDEFLAVLSHELQTPLTSILGWSAEALRTGTPEMMALAMPIVHRNAIRQKQLIADLLDFSRLIHGKIQIMPEWLDLGEQAREAVENVLKQAAERQLRLLFVPSVTPLPVLADPIRLQQCIGNLLQNSLKFTPAGGTISVRCCRDGDQAVLTVEDTGRGIPPEALMTVFEVFHQVDRDERTGGLGLGLAVSRGIIELQDGTIHADSAGCGQGSTFTITLPLAEVSDGEQHDI